MEPVEHTPTEPHDYALLTAAYGSLLATVAFAASRRGAAEVDPIAPAELLPLGAATFALSQALVHEKVETWMRRPFVEEEGTAERRPRGKGLRYAVGELMTCTRCMGTWSALGLVALRMTQPRAGRTVVAVLAAAGLNDFLQSSFAWSRAGATRAEQRSDEPGDGTTPPRHRSAARARR
ncbi:MAG TPA: DUF1360 domain-containing protein, partial [Solirubrobacteraceae bacterium]|jgi:hypothetical protein